MLERQFADFLTAQIKSKVEVLEQETEHQAVKDLRVYIDQLDGLFDSLLQEQSAPKQRVRRSRGGTPAQE
ncbi:hypothetical protein [Alicyclobacillus fastidiosus]|uniref:Uncharacterized protein n=1 Tax=Alicyclobacillus fastidiosus TaxID=392011 RepID=A0ABV5AKH4_9BACL|nr:hypothetical protein [Alicyclobacillus fastidiosus]WEH10998.1 hypothetical protein PYS47_07210 [Alicyclobacillus fastidiosus]